MANKPKEVVKDKVEEKDEGLVTVSKDQLAMFMNKLSKLEKDNEMLKQVADKTRMATYAAQNKEKMPVIVRLRSFEGKVVVGWRTMKNECYKNAQGKWVEDQTVILMFEDGTSTKEIPLLYWIKNYQSHIEAKVISTTQEQDTGETIYKIVRLDNEEEYTIAAKYLN